jgi:hypothetical protein
MSRFAPFTDQELIELEDQRYYTGPASGILDELSAEIDKRTEERRQATAAAKKDEGNASG